MSTPHPPERSDNGAPDPTPHELAEPATEAAPSYPPYSEPEHLAAGSGAYSQAPAGTYAEAATSSYNDPQYGHPDAGDQATTPTAPAPSSAAVRRWQIIAVLAVAAAALTIVGFLLLGLQNRGGTAAPITQTVTEVTEYEGAETTRTQTATTTATETRTATETATETQRETVTRTETETRTATKTVTSTQPATDPADDEGGDEAP